MRFRAISLSASPVPGFSYMQAEKPVIVNELHNNIRSEMLEYSGPSPLVLYAADAKFSPPADGEAPAPIASAEIPSGIQHPLVILIPNAEGESPAFIAKVIEDDPASFPFPGYLFINLSESPITISIGKEDEFVLAAEEMKQLTSEQKAVNLRLSVQKQGSDRWNLIYDNFYPNWPTERTLFVIRETERNGRKYIEPAVLNENKGVWEGAASLDKD